MLETNLAVAVILAGLSLASAAAMRLLGIGMRAMPRGLALATLGAATAVVAYGGWQLTTDPPPTPTMELTPAQTPPPAPAEAPEPASGAIRGSVSTVAGEPLAGAEVVLQRFERTDLAETRTAATGQDGSYAFDDLPTGPTTAYAVAAVHDGHEFGPDLIFLGAHSLETVVDIEVAETTDDDALIAFEMDSTVVAGDEEVLQVLHILSVHNASDRAFVGGLRLPLAPGASVLDPQRGLDRTRLGTLDGSLMSAAPVMPGSTEIVYSYVVATPASGLELGRSLAYPTHQLTILAADGLVVRSDQLTDAGSVDLAEVTGHGTGRQYAQHTARDLPRGAEIAATAGPPGPGAWRIWLPATAILVALFALAFPLLRRRRDPQPPAGSSVPAEVDA